MAALRAAPAYPEPSIANAAPPCLEDADSPSAVTISDLLSGLYVPSALRTPPAPGAARRCCWCGRVERHPGDASRPRWTADSICLPCTIRVQFYDHARSFAVIALPLRALPDLPLRWRVYGELQHAGAGAQWITYSPAAIAARLDRDRRTVSRAITQLAAGGFVERRPQRKRGAITVYEVRLSMGRPATAPADAGPPGRATSDPQ